MKNFNLLIYNVSKINNSASEILLYIKWKKNCPGIKTFSDSGFGTASLESSSAGQRRVSTNLSLTRNTCAQNADLKAENLQEELLENRWLMMFSITDENVDNISQ